MKVCCDTEGRELTDERRYAPTSVPLRRKPCSRSPETLFHFTGIPIQEEHLRAWRVAREEVLVNVLRWLRLVIEHYFAFTAQMYDKEKLLHRVLPDTLWDHMQNFLTNLSGLPCWSDKNLSTTVFGPKQNLDFWEKVFQTGKTPIGIQILAQPLDLNQMIQPHGAGSQP